MKNQKLKSVLVSFFILLCAVLLCVLLAKVNNDNNPFATPVFILAVALIARFTNGFVYGIVASLISVFCVNFLFTYPFLEFDFSISGYPLSFVSMLLVSFIISALTSQIKRQEQLKYEIDAEKMRGNLLRSISHDLRTPLSSILGASSALIENQDMEKENRDDLIREIQKDAKWLIRVMENLLSITKFSGGEVHIKKEAEVLEEIIGSAILKFKKNCADIRVNVHRPERILLVEMDGVLIEQLLVNLFENVADHGKSATDIDVYVSVETGRVCVSIEDNGAGFDEARLSHIFEMNAARSPVTADGKRNMGIGLSVCRSIVRAHGGEITAGNRERGGGIIRFWLPHEEEYDG